MGIKRSCFVNIFMIWKIILNFYGCLLIQRRVPARRPSYMKGSKADSKMFSSKISGTFQWRMSKKFQMMFKIFPITQNYFFLASILSPFIQFVFEEVSLPYPTPFFFLIFLVPSSSTGFLLGERSSQSYLKSFSNFLLNNPVRILSLYKIVEKKSFFNAYSLNYEVLSI